MSSSSSSSSRFNRRQATDVTTICWCGRKLATFCSQTDENPFRRFYRCEITMQRKTDEHLFKWIDEALLEDTRMVDAKVKRLVDEMKELTNEMLAKFEHQQKLLLDMEEMMNEKTNEMMMANATSLEEMANATIEDISWKMARIGITVFVVGAIGWICGKLMSY